MIEKFLENHRTIHEVTESAFKEIEARKNGVKFGYPIGWPIFDEILGGSMTNSRQIVLAGRPGSGKTTLKNIIQMKLIENNPEVDFVFVDLSFEMRSEEHIIKNLSTLSGLTVRQIKSIGGRLSDVDFNRLRSISERLQRNKIYYHDIQMSAEAIKTYAHKYKERFPDSVLVLSLDHMELTQGGKGQSNHERVTDASRGMLYCKQSLDAICFNICQLNREVESPSNAATQYEPELKNLAESGALEKDADAVIMVHRPDAYDPLYSFDRAGNRFLSWYCEPERSAIGELRLLFKKNRHGETGYAYYSHDFSRNLINELE